MRWARAAALPLVLAGVVPATAAAATPKPLPSTSGVAQYVEQLPSAGGSVALGQAPKKSSTMHSSGVGTSTLSPQAQKALETRGGSQAPVLAKIATSPAYGAPVATQPVRRPKRSHPASGNGTAPTTAPASTTAPPPTPESTSARVPATPDALTAAVHTLGAGGVWPLGLALLAITAGSLLVARTHARRVAIGSRGGGGSAAAPSALERPSR